MPVSSRRSVLTAGAWSAPAVVLASGAPAFATSPPVPTEVVHDLNLSGTAGPPLTQWVTSPQLGTFRVAGSVASLGSMTAPGNPDTSFVVGGSDTLGGNAVWLYQERPSIADASQTYASRRQYTISVVPSAGVTPRGLEFTVGRVNSQWSNSTGPRIVSVISAIRAVTPGVVVTAHGSNLYRVAETGSVPEHHAASTDSSGLRDASTCITFTRPGNVTSITFEVWNKAVLTATARPLQTLHVGKLKVATDV